MSSSHPAAQATRPSLPEEPGMPPVKRFTSLLKAIPRHNPSIFSPILSTVKSTHGISCLFRAHKRKQRDTPSMTRIFELTGIDEDHDHSVCTLKIPTVEKVVAFVPPAEHSVNPASIEFFNTTGLDTVSCSPFRVPIDRLVAAQANLRISSSQQAP